MARPIGKCDRRTTEQLPMVVKSTVWQSQLLSREALAKQEPGQAFLAGSTTVSLRAADGEHGAPNSHTCSRGANAVEVSATH